MRRLLLGLAAVIGLIVLLPGVASAHIHVEGEPDLVQGGEGAITFQVPNERDDASTVKVDVQLPTDKPLASVAVQATPGWTFEVKTKKLDTPIKTDEGEVTEVPTEIIWSGGKIGPGELQQFVISAGPMPDVDTLTFPTIQTYSDGQQVAWIEDTPAGGEEPEHPAPTLTLAEPGSGEGSETATTAGKQAISADVPSKDDVDSANTKAIAGTIFGLLGVILGGAALVLAVRKRSAS